MTNAIKDTIAGPWADQMIYLAYVPNGDGEKPFCRLCDAEKGQPHNRMQTNGLSLTCPIGQLERLKGVTP